ncbi:glycosyltransferase [Streptomyces sp. LP05-1]|uniref:Glycosyltransferase n=1 Tax=Streptomyces pyxinae TaxID=2970734 RepID=A0ABT2CHQ1_9ACTN|nr:glycosyltransferase [Streptomyces sp. LP05-1]MCS0636940.1 glycosyltransferase [Streptomyces sp. LP05-1]
MRPESRTPDEPTTPGARTTPDGRTTPYDRPTPYGWTTPDGRTTPDPRQPDDGGPAPAPDAGRPVRVSVIIPAYNARTTLRACLLSLIHQEAARRPPVPEPPAPEPAGRAPRPSYGPDRAYGAEPARAHPYTHAPYTYEVIVVDDGSSDGTAGMLAGFPDRLDLRYVHLPRSPLSGRARARNAGLAMATGELVVTLDADQVVEPGFLGEHVRAHATDPALLVVGRRLQLDEGEIDQEALARGFDLSALPPVVRGDEREGVFRVLACELADMATGWHHAWTCNASVRRDRLIAAGGFDEGFAGWGLEDAELAYRLVRDGAGMRYSTRAAVYHEHRQPVTAAMYREWRENLAYFLRKHPDPAVRLQEMFAPAIDPDRSVHGSWEETAARFEHAARALGGGPRPLSVT